MVINTDTAVNTDAGSSSTCWCGCLSGHLLSQLREQQKRIIFNPDEFSSLPCWWLQEGCAGTGAQGSFQGRKQRKHCEPARPLGLPAVRSAFQNYSFPCLSFLLSDPTDVLGFLFLQVDLIWCIYVYIYIYSQYFWFLRVLFSLFLDVSWKELNSGLGDLIWHLHTRGSMTNVLGQLSALSPCSQPNAFEL